uniref:single-chain LCDV-1 viral insulin-like peptide n=2 Tax=Fish lymphocystis disease virus TaxID=36363 RepID=A0A9X9ZA31_FLDV|nr:Chain C, single-chain LCDV-1 viral insulin-like peptide [Lymphocystis disease virus 1]7U23_D Chain D, single-chain LCDV-1 viral insulin-like peptide [Lymphocystis disease virus 1]
ITAEILCSAHLVAALQRVCGNRGVYRPPPTRRRSTRNGTTGIATKCCTTTGCTTDDLEKYCN